LAKHVPPFSEPCLAVLVPIGKVFDGTSTSNVVLSAPPRDFPSPKFVEKSQASLHWTFLSFLHNVNVPNSRFKKMSHWNTRLPRNPNLIFSLKKPLFFCSRFPDPAIGRLLHSEPTPTPPLCPSLLVFFPCLPPLCILDETAPDIFDFGWATVFSG